MSKMNPTTPDTSKGAIPKKRIINSNNGQGCSSQDTFEEWEFYSIRIRNVCNNCVETLNYLINNNELHPFRNADVCPCCQHKCMHQPYYNICSICARLAKKCAMCCNSLNEDHIDPFSTLLTPMMQAVLESLPDMFQRRLHRFIFKKWDLYLKRQWIPLKQFQKQYLKMCQGIIIEMKVINQQPQVDEDLEWETESIAEEKMEKQRVQNEAARHERRAKHFSKLEDDWRKMEQQRQIIRKQMAEWNQLHNERKETATDGIRTEDEFNGGFVEVNNIEETLVAVNNKLLDLHLGGAVLKDQVEENIEVEELPNNDLLEQEEVYGVNDEDFEDNSSELDEEEQKQLQELLLNCAQDEKRTAV